MDAIVTRPPGGDIAISARGKLYRFLAVCFAHPDKSTLDWWKGPTAIDDTLDIVAEIDTDGNLLPKVITYLRSCVRDIEALSLDEFESTYIRMFVCSVPQVLCPPYSSLYTSANDDKRLADMAAVKEFYESCGMQLTMGFTDLPDHISVEFEFLQYLAFEEERALAKGDDDLAGFFADKAAEFIDRHVVGLLEGMAAVSATIKPSNVFCGVIDIAAEIIRHNQALRRATAHENQSLQKGQDR